MKIIDINNQERECDRVFLDPSWPGYVTVVIPSRVNPDKKRTEWIPLQNFYNNNPDYKDKIENYKQSISTARVMIDKFCQLRIRGPAVRVLAMSVCI